MTHVFTAKLDHLDATLQQLEAFDATLITGRLSASRGHPSIAVGSGGSAVAAQFLAYCRETLGLGFTAVQTPMELVLGADDLSDVDVWLFSAGANNADILAAARAAVQRRCRSLQIVTRGPTGKAAVFVETAGGTVLSIPVASERDGYLATHSMISTISGLLLASDAIVGQVQGQREIVGKLRGRLKHARDPAVKFRLAEAFSTLKTRDTLLLLTDPQLHSVSTLLETSIWEASICPVQRADFRNFAHGRHAWLHHRADETFVLALTSHETETLWTTLSGVFPPHIRRETISFAECGRLSNALGIIDALGIIEAMGQAVGVDPGKPGYGDFGPAVFDDRSLEFAEAELPKPVRHKRMAKLKFDEPAEKSASLFSHFNRHLERLSATPIGGLAFDYDGTLVATSERYEPPRSEIIAELIRLDSQGIKLGIATGRGKSAGADLRKVLPELMHPRVIMGYYNGSHLTTLDVDIAKERPSDSPVIAATAAWLASREDLFVSMRYDIKPLQITIDMQLLHHPYRFRQDLADCPTLISEEVRVTQSGHSFDIVASTASKLAVVEALKSSVPNAQIICFGDSGTAVGNDHALLSSPYGVSVGEVCGSAAGCWSLFGGHPTGPDALLKVLRAMIPSSEEGQVRLSIASLFSNAPQKNNA